LGPRVKITKTFYAPNRKAWREWLRKHAKAEKEVWLIYYRKQSGKARIGYNDAVEEALCFGWIDSTVKTVDAERIAQRFSPRKPNSPYSQTNKERLRRLIGQGKVSKAALKKLGDVSTDGFKIPGDILRALKADRQAWENLQRYSQSYQRIRIAYIDSARKRPGEFEKRLKHFLEMTANDKQFGFGIETYF
jgi:uncharacterized protein YdeI (YjbR/CyaY-like superfamily)